MRIVLITAAILAALTFAACGDDDDEDVGDDTTSQPTATTAGSGDGDNQNIELVAADFEFGPTTLNLAAGETYSMTLINTGQARHGFAVDALDLSEEVDANGEITFDFTAPTADTAFYCPFHPNTMIGSIVVGGSAGGTSTSPTNGASPATTDDDDDGDDDDNDDDNSGPGGGEDIDGGGYGY